MQRGTSPIFLWFILFCQGSRMLFCCQVGACLISVLLCLQTSACWSFWLLLGCGDLGVAVTGKEKKSARCKGRVITRNTRRKKPACIHNSVNTHQHTGIAGCLILSLVPFTSPILHLFLARFRLCEDGRKSARQRRRRNPPYFIDFPPSTTSSH